jgi:hypothetical protein
VYSLHKTFTVKCLSYFCPRHSTVSQVDLADIDSVPATSLIAIHLDILAIFHKCRKDGGTMSDKTFHSLIQYILMARGEPRFVSFRVLTSAWKIFLEKIITISPQCSCPPSQNGGQCPEIWDGAHTGSGHVSRDPEQSPKTISVAKKPPLYARIDQDVDSGKNK